MMKKSEALGAIAFGLVIGVMTVLSRQNGATATLIGLLFALFGGSLTALVRQLAAGDRQWIMATTGCMAGGVLVGLLFGFGLTVLESSYLAPSRTKQQVAY